MSEDSSEVSLISLGDSGDANGTPEGMTPTDEVGRMTPLDPEGIMPLPPVDMPPEDIGLLRSSDDLWTPRREVGSPDPIQGDSIFFLASTH